jgi:DNA-binding NtrC family response regulator
MEDLMAGTTNLQEGRILLYDDDRLLLEVLVKMLGRQGYHVTATCSEQEAIALARKEHFDLAVVDLGRQRSKGYDLVGEIRARGRETSFIAMSAYPALEVVRFAREHDARAFLEKPFPLADLVDVARRVLAEGEEPGEMIRAGSFRGAADRGSGSGPLAMAGA